MNDLISIIVAEVLAARQYTVRTLINRCRRRLRDLPTEEYRLAPVGDDNGKLGSAPGSYQSQDSCPVDCPNAAGCFGKNAHMPSHWKRADGLTPREHMLTALVTIAIAVVKGTKARLHVVGDMGKIGTPYRKLLPIAVTDLTYRLRRAGLDVPPIVAWTYTHHDLAEWERLVWLQAGIRVLRSGVLAAHGATSGYLGPHRSYRLPSGTRIVQCPAQVPGSQVTCGTCLLCARDLPIAINFIPHGGNASKVAIDIDLRGVEQ